jgi:hypothetical protein
MQDLFSTEETPSQHEVALRVIRQMQEFCRHDYSLSKAISEVLFLLAAGSFDNPTAPKETWQPFFKQAWDMWPERGRRRSSKKKASEAFGKLAQTLKRTVANMSPHWTAGSIRGAGRHGLSPMRRSVWALYDHERRQGRCCRVPHQLRAERQPVHAVPLLRADAQAQARALHEREGRDRRRGLFLP